MISSEEFVEELERVLPNVLEPEQQQSRQVWRAAAAASHRVQTILNELLKFPGETVGSRTRADLEAERDRQNALGERYSADAPRIWALEEAGTLERPVYDGPPLTRELLLGHQRWVRAGRTGPGRIDLERTKGEGLLIGAAELTGVRLRGCRLVGINLKYARLNGGEVYDCDFSGGMLDAMSLRDAQVSGCVFISAAVAIGKFERAHLDECDLSRSDLDRSRQLGAVVADDDVTDVAIDPDGQLVALRLACGELELAPLGERRGGATRLSVAQDTSAVAVVAAAVEVTPAAAVMAAVEVAEP